MRFTKIIQKVFFVFILSSNFPADAQKIILLQNAYAHNDYWHKRPLHDALNYGFTYVEADVFLRGNQLIVAHILPCFKKKRTLEELYLKPLLEYITKNQQADNASHSPITLMIDIKSNAHKTYAALVPLLNKYKSILSGYEDGKLTLRSVTIVITGHKPFELIAEKDSRYAFIDEDLKNIGEDCSINIFPIASCKYSSLLKWKGKGLIPEIEKQRLEFYVSQAHLQGRKVRLWASPENKSVWNELLKCNVDLINTDRLKELRNFLIADQALVATAE